MICQKCNFQNEETAKFCRSCGAKLSRKKTRKTLSYIIGGIAIIIIACCCLLFSNNNTQKNNDWTKLNLKGKVKSITQNTYEVKNENEVLTEKNKVDYYNCEINLREHVIENYSVYLNHFDLKFNNIGNIDKYVHPLGEITYRYNEKEQKIEVHFHKIESEYIYTIKYEYDDNKQISKAVYGNYNIKSRETDFYSTILYQYDFGGNLISITEDRKEEEDKYERVKKIIDRNISKCSYTYDDNQRISKIYNIKDYSDRYLDYTANNQLCQRSDQNELETHLLKYEYNEKGDVSKLKIEFKHSYKNSQYYFDVCSSKFDNSSQESKAHYNVIWTYKYEYDQKGNWIKRYKYIEIVDLEKGSGLYDHDIEWLKNLNDKKLIHVTTREFEYY